MSWLKKVSLVLRKLHWMGNLHDRAGVGRDLRPEVSALLGNRASDGRALHLALDVDDDAGVVLEVDVDASLAAPGLALADDDSRHDLLAKLGLALLHGGHDHVTDTSRREAVEAAANALDGDDVQVLGTRVVTAVDDSTDRETQGDTVLVAGGSATSTFRHIKELVGC